MAAVPSVPSVPVYAVRVLDRRRGQLGHALDGRYGALQPAELVALVDVLLKKMDVAGVDVVVGIPEGGYLPAFAFAERVARPLVLASGCGMTCRASSRSRNHTRSTSAPPFTCTA